MSGPDDLKVVSATRDPHGGYIESLLARVAQAEQDAARYLEAWQQAEQEVERMAHQLQRAFDQGFVLDPEPTPNISTSTAEQLQEPTVSAPPPALAG